MGKMYALQATKSYRWRMFKEVVKAGSEDTALVLSHVLSGGAYARRKALGVRSIDKLFEEEGVAPNVVTICPVLGCLSTLTSTFRFGVGTFKGPHNSMDRICLVSAKPGGYRTSCIAPRPNQANPVPVDMTSTYYCDQLAFVDDYGNTVDKIDADSANGKGYIAFDLNGATHMAIYTVSTLPVSGHACFEIAGLY